MSKSHNMIAHEWAHQSKDRAKGFNMYYEGDTIYSYGQHFPIARHVDGVVLFTTDTYGVSTSKHCTITRRACSHLTVFNVPRVNAETRSDHIINAMSYEARMTALIESSMRRRNADNAEGDLKRAQDMCNEHGAYIYHFKLDVKILELPDLEEFRAALDIKIKEQSAATKAKNDARKVEQTRLDALLWTDTIPAWRAGENISLPYWFQTRLLRIKGDNVETSAGAVFPVADMKRAWPILCRMRGVSFTMRGEGRVTFGSFKLDRIDDKGIHVGCHFVEWAEAERLAGELGL